MKHIDWLGAALGVLFAVAASAREPDIGRLKSYVTPGYTIVSREEDTAQRIPTQIAMIDGVLAKLLKRETRVNGAPTYIFVVPVNLWVDFLQPGTGIDSEFVPGRFVNYVVISNSREADVLRTRVYHEITHLFLHTQIGGIIPLWFDEGMARLMQLTEFRGSWANLGQPPVMGFGWMPMNQLLRLDKSSPEYRSAAFTTAVHNESWALVHRGIVADAVFGKQMFAYLDALNDLEPVDEAVQSSFGMSVRQLNRDLHSYVSKASYSYIESSFKILRLEVAMPQPETLEPGRSMSDLESLELLADVMFVSGFKPQRLAEVIAAARRLAPDSPAVHVLRMRSAALIRNDEALEELLGQIEPRLSDPSIARGVGLALFERLNDQRPEDPLSAKQRIAYQQRAHELLDRALRTQPQDPEAVWAFGMLAASTKQLLEPALQRLLSTSASVSMNADIAMATALVYASLQQPDQAIAHLKDTARFSRSVEQRAWARQHMNKVGQAIDKP